MPKPWAVILILMTSMKMHQRVISYQLRRMRASRSIIIVDPHITPENGDFGLFSLPGDDHFTFKQFIIDQGRGYLRSLNPAYPLGSGQHCQMHKISPPEWAGSIEELKRVQ
ncbi:S24 family peptidase [Erwinia sp. MYb416]|uniref:S24 family peptidase n=1 Tax=Erwinia sp. MYb416 TaxID=3108532 RepID=UPI00403F0127